MEKLCCAQSKKKKKGSKTNFVIVCWSLRSETVGVTAEKKKKRKEKKKKTKDQYCRFKGFMRNLAKKSITTPIRFKLDSALPAK